MFGLERCLEVGNFGNDVAVYIDHHAVFHRESMHVMYQCPFTRTFAVIVNVPYTPPRAVRPRLLGDLIHHTGAIHGRVLIRSTVGFVPVLLHLLNRAVVTESLEGFGKGLAHKLRRREFRRFATPQQVSELILGEGTQIMFTLIKACCSKTPYEEFDRVRIHYLFSFVSFAQYARILACVNM